MSDTSSRLNELSLVALDHAMEFVTREGGALVPFTLVEAEGKRHFVHFDDPIPEEGVAAAREHLRLRSTVERAALAWCGFVTIAGHRSDAVIIETSVAGCDESDVIAQRYEQRGVFRKKTVALGAPLLVGHEHPLF